MQKIDSYKITYRPSENAGQIHIALGDGTGSSIMIDSPQEMLAVVDVLRNEAPVYWDAKHGMLMTGYEETGEEEG